MRTFVFNKGNANPQLPEERYYYAKDDVIQKDENGNVIATVSDPVITKLIEYGYEEVSPKK